MGLSREAVDERMARTEMDSSLFMCGSLEKIITIILLDLHHPHGHPMSAVGTFPALVPVKIRSGTVDRPHQQALV